MIKNFTTGTIVSYKSKPVKIIATLELNLLKVKRLSDSRLFTANINELDACNIAKKDAGEIELSVIDNKYWDIALFRYSVVKPYLDYGENNAEKLNDLCVTAGVDLSTAYRWIDRFKLTGKISSLLPKKRGRKDGIKLINKDVEAVISEYIKKYYLRREKPSVSSAVRSITFELKKRNLPFPHANTIRNRINSLSRHQVKKSRDGSKAMREAFESHMGKYEHASWPLHIVQIDHTPVDMIIVSEDERLPIGRPWMTVAIDVYSRTILGFYLSLDAPSALSVGLCLSHAILPKDDWLLIRGISGSWPAFGLFDTVHADNAKEFRGEMLKRACQEYTMDLQWRPVGRSHFGGHIERLLGTFNTEYHEVPGTTFSNTELRGDYDSEGNAIMTFAECEKYIATYIVKRYHHSPHAGLNMNTPLAKFEEGIIGSDDVVGRGIPPVPEDERKLMIDFLPVITRSVQKYGILIDHIFYMHDVIRIWINAVDAETKKKQQFIIRRDPRDISKVYFWDPELKRYFDIPYRDLTHPQMTLWELKEVNRYLEQKGYENVDEALIFQAFEEMEAIKDEAIVLTKKARRKKSSKQVHKMSVIPEDRSNTSDYIGTGAEEFEDDDDDIKAFSVDVRR